MTKAYIGLGSNIQPERFILMALERLNQKLKIVSISSFYRTKAVGTALGQDDFINGMILVETDLSAQQLKYSVLREIEYELGRLKEMPKHAPRNMDLDLVIFGDEFIEELNIPEKDLLNRPYVYVPLLDIDPLISVPGHTFPLQEMLKFKKQKESRGCIKGKVLSYLSGTEHKIHELNF
ncbi:MAG: 2-amino-4-hydroxy-6-hydroxymethyldihydropteridine diphosphokinase [Lentisphaeraceae bacterium]|nr:2-amino-4-hydroxy-6-hydroxymethyldihydropteridine diphosphokinase [Lentisphaeraceae bacterium]